MEHFVFNTYLFRRTLSNQISAAVMMQALRSFYANYSKNSLFLSANTYEKYTAFEDHCNAHHNDKLCFLPNCWYHNILLGAIHEFQQILDSLCFPCNYVDWLHTLFEYRFSGRKMLPRVEKCLMLCKEQSTLTKGGIECTKFRALQKNDCWENVENTFFELIPKDKINSNKLICIFREIWTS